MAILEIRHDSMIGKNADLIILFATVVITCNPKSYGFYTLAEGIMI